MRRPFRRTAVVLALALGASGLAGCGEVDDRDQQMLVAALDKAMSSPRSFVHIDQDLQHKTVVSGEIADSLRYKLLLNIDGRPVWQKVVRDDAVADLFLDTSQVTTYAGAGSSPAVNVVSDYQQLVNFLPKNIPPPPFEKLPKTEPIQPSLALAALQQGKWVLDKTGAPPLPSTGTSAEALATSPFLRPMLMLAFARESIARMRPQGVQKYSKDDLTPFFKPVDDPFPQPAEGVDRYDVEQTPLPMLTGGQEGSRPPEPELSALRKLAIYMKDGKVVEVRENFDVLDRLEDLARLYQIPLEINSSLGTVTQQRIGQLLVQLVQDSKPVPYRVHEEQLYLSYPEKPPVINLPKPVVLADLSLFPGQGKKAETSPTAEEGANSGDTGSTGGDTGSTGGDTGSTGGDTGSTGGAPAP